VPQAGATSSTPIPIPLGFTSQWIAPGTDESNFNQANAHTNNIIIINIVNIVPGTT
jgi:hypothetical protein